MKNSKIIFLIPFLLSFSVQAITVEIFSEMVKCREKIDLNDRKKSEKFFACVEPYLHPQEGKFVKEQIALALFQMEKITNPTECVGDLKKNLESVYQKGLSFVCFKSVVDGKEKESFAVFQKNEKTKSWRNAKIIRLKYH